jgi:DNA-binding NarL/FixJ family response regulator
MVGREAPASSLGIAIVEDSAMLGELIEEAIVEHPGLHVTGRVRTAREAHESIPWARTHLASIDLHLPDGLGIALGARVRASYPHMRVLILSDHRRPSLLHGLDPKDLAFWSYALKSSIEGRRGLADVLHRAAQGPWIDPKIEAAGSSAEVAIAELSDQQRRVLGLVAKGMSNSAIAERLSVTDKAVEYHLKQIYLALDLAPAAEANQRVLAAVAYLQQYAPDTHV